MLQRNGKQRVNFFCLQHKKPTKKYSKTTNLITKEQFSILFVPLGSKLKAFLASQEESRHTENLKTDFITEAAKNAHNLISARKTSTSY